MHICVQHCQQVELPQQAQFINCPTVSNSHTHTERDYAGTRRHKRTDIGTYVCIYDSASHASKRFLIPESSWERVHRIVCHAKVNLLHSRHFIGNLTNANGSHTHPHTVYTHTRTHTHTLTANKAARALRHSLAAAGPSMRVNCVCFGPKVCMSFELLHFSATFFAAQGVKYRGGGK